MSSWWKNPAWKDSDLHTGYSVCVSAETLTEYSDIVIKTGWSIGASFFDVYGLTLARVRLFQRLTDKGKGRLDPSCSVPLTELDYLRGKNELFVTR